MHIKSQTFPTTLYKIMQHIIDIMDVNETKLSHSETVQHRREPVEEHMTND